MSRFVSLSSTTRMRGGSFMATTPGLTLVQILSDLLEHHSRAERLGHPVVTPPSPRLLLVAAQRIGGERDDRDRLERRIRLELACRLISIQHWKLNVHENEIRPVCGCRGQGLAAVASFKDVKSGIGEKIPQDAAIIFLIFDDKN